MFKKKDQNMISGDIVNDITITQDTKGKCMGINLFDISTNKCFSASIVNKRFRHLITEEK